MDPSAALCRSYDTLTQSPIVAPSQPLSYTQSDLIEVSLDLRPLSINDAPPPVYVDQHRYEILQKVKRSFNVPHFQEARDATNPFEHIGKSIFINRAAVKLANIDAVFEVSGQFGFDHQQSEAQFTFCDIAAGPGSFTQYLQYRYPNARGFGITLRKPSSLDWSLKFIDQTRFEAFYGPDETGDLYTNWHPFITHVLTAYPEGVDLVTADGGFETLERQEFLSSRLLATQATVGIACTKIGGNFVLKVFDTVTTFSAQVLFMLSLCFDQIYIFKPVSSRPANAEKYVICQGRRPIARTYFGILASMAAAYEADIYWDSFIAQPLPSAFTDWLVESNNTQLGSQLQTAHHIISYLKGMPPDLPVYDLAKFLILWNLPDTPRTKKNSRIVL
jgi:23S rRNA U2552 (ribose-2'-O)-methylase RlmE/FtsJ